MANPDFLQKLLANIRALINFVGQDELKVAGPDLLALVNYMIAHPADVIGGNLQLGKAAASLLSDEHQVAQDTAQFALNQIKTAIEDAMAAVPAAAPKAA